MAFFRTEPDKVRPAAGRVLAVAAGFVLAAVLGVVGWLTLLGPPRPPVAAVAVPPAPKAEQPPAPAPAAPAPTPEPEPSVAVNGVPAQPPIAPPPSFSEGRALLPAPDPDLIEKTPVGFLPIVGRDGRQAWQVYGRPFDLSDKRPRVAILVGELGISPTTTDNAINQLPAAVTLAFVTYKQQLGEWINLARAAGHEVMLDLPMEPVDYPRADPGPNALLTSLTPEKNMDRLNWNLAQATGYVGLVGHMGSRFTTSRDDLLPLLKSIKERGLLFVDNRASPQTAIPGIAGEVTLPLASANRLLDTDPTRAGIDKKLSELEEIARRNGSALGLAQHIEPVVMERIGVWAQGLEERGLVLAPVSAVVGAKPAEPAVAEKPAGDKSAGDKPAPPKPAVSKPSPAPSAAAQSPAPASSPTPEHHE